MKLLTRNTDYAVRAICFLANKKGAISDVPGMVKELGIPRPFLRKILQTLAREGVVTSTKGVGGGFRLSVKPEAIYLADLIRIFQGQIKVNECIFKKKICPNVRTCPLKTKIDAIERLVASKLDSITIGGLLR